MKNDARLERHRRRQRRSAAPPPPWPLAMLSMFYFFFLLALCIWESEAASSSPSPSSGVGFSQPSSVGQPQGFSGSFFEGASGAASVSRFSASGFSDGTSAPRPGQTGLAPPSLPAVWSTQQTAALPFGGFGSEVAVGTGSGIGSGIGSVWGGATQPSLFPPLQQQQPPLFPSFPPQQQQQQQQQQLPGVFPSFPQPQQQPALFPLPLQQQQQQQHPAPQQWPMTVGGGSQWRGSSSPSIVSGLGQTGQTELLTRLVADCLTPNQALPTQDWEQNACVSAYTVASLTNDAVQNLKWGFVEISCSPQKQETTFVLQSVPRFANVNNPFRLLKAAARRFAQSRDVMVYKRPLPPACECIEGDLTNFFSVGYAKEQYLHSIQLRTSPARKFLFFPRLTNCPLPEVPGNGAASKMLHVAGGDVEGAEIVLYANEVQPIGECFFKIAIRNPTAVIGTRRHVVFAFSEEKDRGKGLGGGSAATLSSSPFRSSEEQPVALTQTAVGSSSTASKLLLPRRCFMSSPQTQLLVWAQDGLLRPRGEALEAEEKVTVFYVFARGDELLNRRQAPSVPYQQLLTHSDFDLALKHGFNPQRH